MAAPTLLKSERTAPSAGVAHCVLAHRPLMEAAEGQSAEGQLVVAPPQPTGPLVAWTRYGQGASPNFPNVCCRMCCNLRSAEDWVARGIDAFTAKDLGHFHLAADEVWKADDVGQVKDTVEVHVEASDVGQQKDPEDEATDEVWSEDDVGTSTKIADILVRVDDVGRRKQPAKKAHADQLRNQRRYIVNTFPRLQAQKSVPANATIAGKGVSALMLEFQRARYNHFIEFSPEQLATLRESNTLHMAVFPKLRTDNGARPLPHLHGTYGPIMHHCKGQGGTREDFKTLLMFDAGLKNEADFYNYEEPAFENRKYKPSENVKSTEHCEHGDAKGYSRV